MDRIRTGEICWVIEMLECWREMFLMRDGVVYRLLFYGLTMLYIRLSIVYDDVQRMLI